MTDTELQFIKDAVKESVDKTVNGKIDKLRKDVMGRFERHEEKMQPIYEAYSTAGNVGKFTIFIAKIIGAIGVITGAIIAGIKFLK